MAKTRKGESCLRRKTIGVSTPIVSNGQPVLVQQEVEECLLRFGMMDL